MKNKKAFVIFLDLLQIFISIIIMIYEIILLLKSNHDYREIISIIISFVSLISIISGLSNLKFNYAIYKELSIL